MTKTTELNAENGTCIGCRLPWNEESVTGYYRNAVLVIADDAGMEVTEILLPLNTAEQKDLAEPEISTGQPVREVLILPLEQSMSGRQMTQAEPEISAEQATPGGQTTQEEPDIPIKHVNREEPEISAEQSTPGEKLTPAEPDTPIKHPDREEQGVGDDPHMPVKPATPKGQKTQAEPELYSTPAIIIGVRV